MRYISKKKRVKGEDDQDSKGKEGGEKGEQF